MIGEKLSMLFDYQRIAENERLARVIDETGSLGSFLLTEEDLEKVAGGQGLPDQQAPVMGDSKTDFDQTV